MRSTGPKSWAWCPSSANLLSGPSYLEWTFQKAKGRQDKRASARNCIWLKPLTYDQFIRRWRERKWRHEKGKCNGRSRTVKSMRWVFFLLWIVIQNGGYKWLLSYDLTLCGHLVVAPVRRDVHRSVTLSRLMLVEVDASGLVFLLFLLGLLSMFKYLPIITIVILSSSSHHPSIIIIIGNIDKYSEWQMTGLRSSGLYKIMRSFGVDYWLTINYSPVIITVPLLQ